jgi:4'-phosphopantetheinyl transferase
MVEVWVADLAVPAWVEAALFDVLGDDEQGRAKAFRLEHLRRRFTVSHAMVRSLVAERVGQDAASLRFVTGPHGKPALASAGVEFNLAHSGERALVALSDAQPVGVDIEEFRVIKNVHGVAQRILSPAEFEAFQHAVDPATFVLDHWTRKEAVLKACGDGITRELRGVDVALAKRLRVDAGYLAAVALDGALPETTVRKWAPALTSARAPAAVTPV